MQPCTLLALVLTTVPPLLMVHASLALQAPRNPATLTTPCRYMSPEVFMYDDISPALDIYSLGIIRESRQSRLPSGFHAMPPRRR